MEMKRVLGVIILLLFGSVAYAQEKSGVEAGLNYSYLRFNPGGSIGGKSFNGGGGDVTWFLTGWLGAKAEFEGYGSTQTTFVTSTGATRAQGNAFSYNFGPVVRFKVSRFHPFVEALGGGVHTNLYRNACSHGACTGPGVDNNAGSFIIGGGLDFPVGDHLSIRPLEVDYVLTRFDNRAIGGNQTQSNVRYVGGVRWRF
jgi:hypothetical protein